MQTVRLLEQFPTLQVRNSVRCLLVLALVWVWSEFGLLMDLVYVLILQRADPNQIKLRILISSNQAPYLDL